MRAQAVIGGTGAVLRGAAGTAQVVVRVGMRDPVARGIIGVPRGDHTARAATGVAAVGVRPRHTRQGRRCGHAGIAPIVGLATAILRARAVLRLRQPVLSFPSHFSPWGPRAPSRLSSRPSSCYYWG